MAAYWELVFDDTGLFATDPTHPAWVDGFMHSTLFAGGRAEVVGGEAHTLVAADGDPTRKRMRYRVLLRVETGSAFTLTGVKNVESGRLRKLWRETTTLDSRIVEGHVEQSEDGGAPHRVLAAGY